MAAFLEDFEKPKGGLEVKIATSVENAEGRQFVDIADGGMEGSEVNILEEFEPASDLFEKGEPEVEDGVVVTKHITPSTGARSVASKTKKGK